MSAQVVDMQILDRDMQLSSAASADNAPGNTRSLVYFSQNVCGEFEWRQKRKTAAQENFYRGIHRRYLKGKRI